MHFESQFDVFYGEFPKFNAVWAKFSEYLPIFRTRLKESFRLFIDTWETKSSLFKQVNTGMVLF